MLIAGDQVMSAGKNSGSANGRIFRRQDDAAGRKSSWNIGNLVGFVEQTRQPGGVSRADTIPPGFIRSIGTGYRGEIPHLPELQEAVILFEGGREKNVAVKKNAQEVRHAFAAPSSGLREERDRSNK